MVRGIRMIFDQYQRYETISRMISTIKERMKVDKIRILEVGANAQKTLSKFINDEIYFTDIQNIEELESDDHFFVADATNLEGIEDNNYDIVVASDVYEHVPKQYREAFISEIYRVSKYGVIICFPIGNKVTEEAEKAVNDRNIQLFGVNHRWLIEHIENGLPTLKDVESIFKNKDIEYAKMEHGDIRVWEKLQKTIINMSAIQQIPALERIDDIYNNYIYEGDYGENNYRIFYLLMKNIENKETIKNNICKRFEKQKISDKYFQQIEEIEQTYIISKFMYNDVLTNQLIDVITKQNDIISNMQIEFEKLKNIVEE